MPSKVLKEQQMKKYVVLDSNVVISAILSPSGSAYLALEKSLKNFKIIEPLRFGIELIEFADKLKIGKKKALDPINVSRILKEISKSRIITYVKIKNIQKLSRDPKDDDYLAVAIENKAILITGDKDLITLKDEIMKKFKIPIQTPSEFLGNE